MPILSWINDNQARQQASNVPFHLLEKVQSYGDSDSENMLIQGDNLLALKALLPFYRGKVKCIYIDPPYNTGSAFDHYDDNLEHSQWLSMMYARLCILRDFLSEDGSFFVSIDDKEGCYLKVLLDEIFGRKNFVTSFIWQKVDSPNDNKVSICPDHEFIHCYAKNIQRVNFKKMSSTSILDAYHKKDENGRLYRDRLLRKNGKNSLRQDRPTMWFPLVDPDGNEVWPIQDDGKEGRWAVGKDGVERLIKGGLLVWQKRLNKSSGLMVWTPYSREFAPDNPVRPYMSIWCDVKTTRQAKAHHKTLFESNLLDTIKPEELIKRILEMATERGDLVLDSFLGSGTTASVAHKMQRRYIGIEMGEHAVSLCLPRLKKVINGEQGGITESVDWQGGGGFGFYKLGEPVFDEYGAINPRVDFKTLAAFIWQRETNSPMVCQHSPMLGEHNGKSVFLLFNGILGDTRPKAGNVLNRSVLKKLLSEYPSDNVKVVYGDACLGISDDELKAQKVIFKQIPYDLGV